MPKRLVVDDIRTLPLDDATTVRTCSEAILLVSEQWDEIWLDYDMGGKPYETDDALTIMPFVNALVEYAKSAAPEDNLPTIYIHTMNPVGRSRITKILEECFEVRQAYLRS